MSCGGLFNPIVNTCQALLLLDIALQRRSQEPVLAPPSCVPRAKTKATDANNVRYFVTMYLIRWPKAELAKTSFGSRVLRPLPLLLSLATILWCVFDRIELNAYKSRSIIRSSRPWLWCWSPNTPLFLLIIFQ